jgi:hypothetical protein
MKRIDAFTFLLYHENGEQWIGGKDLGGEVCRLKEVLILRKMAGVFVWSGSNGVALKL